MSVSAVATSSPRRWSGPASVGCAGTRYSIIRVSTKVSSTIAVKSIIAMSDMPPS